MTNKDYYYKRKWKLLRETSKAFPHFPKVGNARKRRLVSLMTENEGCTADEADAWVMEQIELEKKAQQELEEKERRYRMVRQRETIASQLNTIAKRAEKRARKHVKRF